MEIGSKELVATKIPPQTHTQKEIKKEIGIKIAKQAKAKDSKNQKKNHLT